MVANTTTTATQADRDQYQARAEGERTALARLKKYISADVVRSRFEEMMSAKDAAAYINSVVIAVANGTDQLKACSPESIVGSALRAATLRLSCDPAVKQAHLVPYGNKATLIVHYQGYVDLALRTNRYRTIHVTEIYDGEEIAEDRITGRITLSGGRASDLVKGWLAYLEMVNGFSKALYMTKEQIHDHAKKYSKSYWRENGLWQKDPGVMERKTVLRTLMIQWGAFSESEKRAMQADDEIPGDEPIAPGEHLPGEKTIDAVAKDAPAVTPEPAVQDPEPPEEEVPAGDVELERPMPPAVLRSYLAAQANSIGIYQATDQQRSLMCSLLEYVFAPDKDTDKIRRSCIRFLWGYDSSKKMSGPQVKATLDWLKPQKDSGGAYFPDAMAATELKSVWVAELKAKGQGSLPGMDEPHA
jgi:recombination protein RecT